MGRKKTMKACFRICSIMWDLATKHLHSYYDLQSNNSPPMSNEKLSKFCSENRSYCFGIILFIPHLSFINDINVFISLSKTWFEYFYFWVEISKTRNICSLVFPSLCAISMLHCLYAALWPNLKLYIKIIYLCFQVNTM